MAAIIVAAEMLLFDQGFGDALLTAVTGAVLLVVAVEIIERLRRKRARSDQSRE